MISRENLLEQQLREKTLEIERLNNLLKETSQTLSEQTTKVITLKSENERLNNIINELEKDMIFDMNDYGKNLDIQTGNIYLEYYRGYCQNGKDYYDKLQELKGSDKE